MLFRICAVLCNFYPRPPRGGRPVCFAAGRVSVSISIHALREEGDSSPIFKKVAILNFYPRPPRGGRRGVCAGIVAPELISIHALREEGDQVFGPLFLLFGISIHALREEGDRFTVRPVKVSGVFLSTPSARRATKNTVKGSQRGRFLSTPSARRATSKSGISAANVQISIHALREEGDHPCRMQPTTATHFYPRPPRGGRPMEGYLKAKESLFLSTPSARRATQQWPGQTGCRAISIHALREEGDSKNRDKISIFKQIIQHSARI